MTSRKTRTCMIRSLIQNWIAQCYLGLRARGTVCYGGLNLEDRGQKIDHGIEEDERIAPVFAAQEYRDDH